MFLLDSLLMAPGNAAFVLFKELARKAQEEWLDDDSVKQELQELYAMLESGRISDRDFEARECRLLERLEQIARAKFRDKWGDEEVTPVAPESAAPLALPPVEDVAARELTRELPPPQTPLVPPLAADIGLHAPLPPVTAKTSPSVAVAPPPVPLAQPVPSAPLPIPGEALTVFQALDSATRALAMLKLRISSVTSVASDEEGWKVTAELVERKGVPDTNDLLGVYELRLDPAGNVLRYERTRLRRRGDLSRG